MAQCILELVFGFVTPCSFIFLEIFLSNDTVYCCDCTESVIDEYGAMVE
jgi:hypothetical protein